jgi:hypothetical protein
VLVKWWLLAIPQLIVVGILETGLVWSRTITENGQVIYEVGTGLIGLLVFIAGVILLFTGKYPQGLFDFVMGLNRWVFRVWAYIGLMRDEYPPFRFDAGGTDPGSTGPDAIEPS